MCGLLKFAQFFEEQVCQLLLRFRVVSSKSALGAENAVRLISVSCLALSALLPVKRWRSVIFRSIVNPPDNKPDGVFVSG